MSAGAGVPVPAVCLVILDGWGLAPAGPGNAVSLAHTPVFDDLWSSWPHTQLTACGPAVGLPRGQMGNSEVGHLNLGAGTVVKQDLTRIDDAVDAGRLGENPVLRGALGWGGRVHLVGLVSEGGVHASMGHLRALIELARELGVGDLVLHAFTDGRDTLPHAGAGALEAVEGWMTEARIGRVGSIVGRYWAMDRDRHWDRTQRAYDLLVHGRAPFSATSAVAAVRAAYGRGETDEFIQPTVVGEGGVVRSGDSVLGLNFRPDRMRQITRALAEPGFSGVDRRGAEPVARYATMAQYEEGWPYPVAFAPHRPRATLARAVAAAGARQLHVAETEKYAHVTYFFNGGDEEPVAGERRELVDSPRGVATYDHRPEMSARAAAEAFVRAWRQDQPRFAIINFANPDMVGHTGVIDAAVVAIETVDASLGDVVAVVHAGGGVCLVTADHGNADHMLEPDGSPNTAHTLNPVPLVMTFGGGGLRDGGVLADVAPTVLGLLGIQQPEAMGGRSLLDGGATQG